MFRAVSGDAVPRVLGTLLLAMYLSTSLPLRAQMLATPNPDVQSDPLQKWDGIAENLRKLAWTMHTLSDVIGKDIRGRTVDDDVNEYVLAPQTLTQLDTLREMARAQLAAADTAGVESTFKEATPLLQTQLVTAVLVMAYWTAESAVAYHQAVLQPWIDLAPEAQQKVLGDHINATKQSLVKALDAGLTETNVERRAESVKLFRSTETAAVGYYNQQRRVLVDQLAKLPGAPPLISRKRESECPPPVLPLAGKENPSLAPGNAAPEEVYPPKSKFNEVEGSIVLQVSITETGCMEFAQVMGSSGVNELDEAALLWAERANFVPAEKDHKPVAGILPFKMKFRLGD